MKELLQDWRILGILGAFSWAAFNTLTKYLYQNGASVASTILYPSLVYAALYAKGFSVPSGLLPYLILLGIIGALANFFTMHAFKQAPNPGYVVPLIGLSSIITAVASMVLLKAPVNLQKIAGMIIILVGVYLIVV